MSRDADRLLDAARRGLPPYRGPAARRAGVEIRRQAASGEISVVGECLPATVPIDWHQDPIRSRSWRYELHTMSLLDPFIQLYLDEGDEAAIRQALAISTDWICQNQLGESGISEFAWYDMAVGIRAPLLVYSALAAAQCGLLDTETAEVLVESVKSHGAFLADSANYAHGHNHGLFQDEGLLLLAHTASFLPDSKGWREIAMGRALATLRTTVNWQEGVHLEHSAAYHFAIVNMVRRLLEIEPQWPQLSGLVSRLESAAPWFVMPDNHLVPLGDTDSITAPNWVREQASALAGMRAMPASGYVAVRDGDSYLIISGGYHSHGHKQADELTFVLHEAGNLLVGDPGRFGYYEEEEMRIFARSAAAHNVLLVDDQDFPWKKKRAYGSCIRGVGEGSGWYAVEGNNPLLDEVDHRRWFLYRPHEMLLICDVVSADSPQQLTRLLHLGPGVQAEKVGQGAFALKAGGATASVSGWANNATDADASLGESWWFPKDRAVRPTTCLRFTQSSAGSVRSRRSGSAEDRSRSGAPKPTRTGSRSPAPTSPVSVG